MSGAIFIELFAWPLAALALVGVVAPLNGAFLLVRGTAFHGIALPQAATFGVALGFVISPHADSDPPFVLLLAAASTAVFVALWIFERDRGADASRTSRAATVFAVASGGTVIASEVSPSGGLHVDALLSGETLSTGPVDVALLAGVTVSVLAVVARHWRRITVAGHDPEFAQALGLRPARANLCLHAITAAVVISGSLTVGALPMFALLVIPPAVARSCARSMRQFLALSSTFGILSATAGACFSFGLDVSMDASIVAGSVGVAAFCVMATRQSRPRRSARSGRS